MTSTRRDMALFTTKRHTLGKLNFNLLHFRLPVVTDLFAGFLEITSAMLLRMQLSSLLLIPNLSLKATSVHTETLQSLPHGSAPPAPTSGALEIPPCRMGSLHTHTLAFQCNPRAWCRIHWVAPAVPILLSRLILLQILPLQRGQEMVLIRKVSREPRYPLLSTIPTMTSISSSVIRSAMASWLEEERDQWA